MILGTLVGHAENIISTPEIAGNNKVPLLTINVGEEDVKMESTFVDDLGADSLDIFQIIMGIEEAFDIEIENEDAEKIVTVGDAVEQIKNAVN